MNEQIIPSFHQLNHTLSDEIYLNTGTCAPSINFVTESIIETYKKQEKLQLYPWIEAEQAFDSVRQRLADLLDVHHDQIVVTENTTQGLNMFLHGLHWRTDDEIITTNGEHVSSLAPCFSIAQRYGVKVRIIDILNKTDDEIVDEISHVVNDKTKLLLVSHITWNTGRVLPIEKLCALARAANVYSLIDGAQAVGQMNVNPVQIGCDVYAFPGHKWLLGPLGTGSLYMRGEIIQAISPINPGYYSIEGFKWDGTLKWKQSGQKFESSTRNVAPFVGLARSIVFIQEIGIHNIEKRIHILSEQLRTNLELLQGVKVNDMNSQIVHGLISCTIDKIDYHDLVEFLAKKNIFTRSITRPKGLRISVHAFNTEEELTTFISVLEKGIRKLRKHPFVQLNTDSYLLHE
ncbi:aminotransferase class V-fold PLP-dependent enzyme [Priestia taiwanensis]|uniref:Cysteine lyase n=1 Tax=Priestia taiwanensis TaxID=1347902 RepID=A0A917AJ43_9BACI|nr:aminotransferase class V-fold PLP-dependent enzyme [Priestia taiwanensis]MBM7361800.1 L-cysteine/cystine lyase [Priestia taiwanensis]GGE57086.1 cysteine lyase [Priestia taiwanensis]